MPITDLYAEYNKRTGGNIIPPKKVINCAASTTTVKIGESVTEVFRVKKGQVSPKMSHIATSNFKFGETPGSNEWPVRPSKVRGDEISTADHIEFGLSEQEVIRVKKGQAPEDIIHVAETKIAFGSRNIPTEKDATKPAKKPTAEGLDSAADHIVMGAALEKPAPGAGEKCGVLETFEQTEQNMAPTEQSVKPVKAMIDCAAAGNKELMMETLTAPDGLQAPPSPVTPTRLPVGGNTAITFGDTYSPAPSPLQTKLFSEVDVKSPAPVQVNHTTRNMQSSCFDHDMAAPVDRRTKKEVENTCPNEVSAVLGTSPTKSAGASTPPKSAKKKTIHSDRESLNSIFCTDGVDDSSSRSAKKTIPVNTVFSFASSNETGKSPKETLMPTVPKKIAAGSKPKPLEPVVKTRGPVGGTVSVIFG